ncbi:MAG: glycosyl hydrolase family 95 catalytic domain-containing protein [Terrimicrobiaceae bacterium]
MTNPPTPLTWHFPLHRPHTGVPIGNGIQGLLIWGESSLLITVARAGFWDRRGGQDIPAGTTFSAVRHALEVEDDAALESLFPNRQPGAPFPQQMGGGRLEISFASGLRPMDASLDLATAEVRVRIARHEEDPAPRFLVIRQACEKEVFWISGDPGLLADLSIRLLPAYDLVRDHAMAALGMTPPEVWGNSDQGGFLQTLPAGASLAVAWQKRESQILLATALGEGGRDDARLLLQEFDIGSSTVEILTFWSSFWNTSARVSLPDATLQQQFDYGLYRQAGLIRRHAPAATLQGPWMEDTAIPPWSNDYHFNINVQLVYGAALATGQAREMQPLWDMLRAWLPRLRSLGEGFYGLPGAMILPHAVDDRCQMMGTFWAGAIDQACIAWMARMAYQFYCHTGDRAFLQEVAWPLLEGAFLGYFAMLETITEADGSKRYSLPVSVSPEFGDSDPRMCWGRDASFQLAALHATLRHLRETAPVLGLPEDPRWAEVSAHLPPYSLADAGSYGPTGSPAKRIALWEGRDLTESHRHHSHLASIYPFCTVNPFDPAHQKVVARSLNRWSALGSGHWTGWCVPWASILCSRCGLPDAALSWLHILAEAFTNEGYATLANADWAGMFTFDDGSLASPDHRKRADFLSYEIMQMDAAMGALSAILEMLVCWRDEAIHIADRLPKRWRDASFCRVRMEGGFSVSGSFRYGRSEELVISSERGGKLRLAHSLGATWMLDNAPHDEPLLELMMAAGQTCTLRRVLDQV